MKKLELNPGAQREFVHNPHRASAFIGGLGSGKTFAGIARGLKFSQQPKAGYYGPKGLVAAVNFPVLRDVVLPLFHEMVAETGLVKRYRKAEKKAELSNGGEILFRSLDEPEWMRGIEISWFFIDEGRHIGKGAWDILLGRMRQKGYKQGGWVCSTPNGHDWLWQVFHPDSPQHREDAMWYGAPTHENARNLEPEYLADLEANYEGRYYEQEVLGRFIGAIRGAVFPSWNSQEYMRPVDYDPELPLYTFWDFGVGDIGVCLFVQLDYKLKPIPSGGTEYVPELRVIDVIEAKAWGAGEWAKAWHAKCQQYENRPVANYGDPAGRQRNVVTGTSMMDALSAKGVRVAPARKRPVDFAILILDNIISGGRLLVDKRRCQRVGAALATHKWNVDDEGNRIGNAPVHDWTSHFVDALRYGVTMLLSHFPRREPAAHREPPGPGTLGHVLEQLDRPREWLGQPEPDPEWWPVATR